jgi:nucleotide-binding universal stress UspA family protein
MSPAPNIRHILVPHDFSETAEYALSYALALADKFAARITVVHAYEVPAYGYPDALVASLEFTAEIERTLSKSLEEVKARASSGKVPVEAFLRRGTAWSEITAAATESKADLIVMGTHGRRGVARALLGSVAEKVVRTATCPVLTVHLPESAQRPALKG